jgi:hypothetical protein
MASANIARSLVRVDVKNTAVFLCDMQEKFRFVFFCIFQFNFVLSETKFSTLIQSLPFHVACMMVSIPLSLSLAHICQGARILNMPTLVTEHYTKGFGYTVPELGICKQTTPILEKERFSMILPRVKVRFVCFRNLVLFSTLCC